MISRRFVVRALLALMLAAPLGTAAAREPDERFYIIGFIKEPGAYLLKPNMTVGDAIDAAGGFLPNRTVTQLQIHRIVDGEKQTIAAGLMDRVQALDTVSVK